MIQFMLLPLPNVLWNNIPALKMAQEKGHTADRRFTENTRNVIKVLRRRFENERAEVSSSEQRDNSMISILLRNNFEDSSIR